MKLSIVTICVIYLSTVAIAVPLSLTNVNDAQSNQLFSQLISEQEPTVAASAMSSLLAYMAPSIKQISGYKGLFAGNCSVFFSNTTIEEVGCNIIPVALVSVTDGYQLAAPTRLPGEYATQITQSHILLASLWADWSRKLAQKLEQFEVNLYPRVSTCTQSATESETQSASETSLSETLSKTAINSHTVLELLSRSVSVSESATSSLSSSINETDSTTKSSSQSNSSSLTGTISETLTRVSGLLAAWNATSGAYDDSTSQLDRYNASNGVVTDTFTGLNWQQASSNTTMSWNDAVLYCSNRTTGGFTDWQLPNNAELQSLVDYTIAYVGQTAGINAIFLNTPTNYFYSSTPLVGSVTQQPWWVSFGWNTCYSGLLDSFQYVSTCTPAVANQGYARCVRSPNGSLPTKRYVKTSNTAIDTVTGLIWQRVSTNTTMNQTAAVTHCNALNLLDFSSSWRIPTVRELATLVDYSISSGNLMMDATVFSGEPVGWFWSSTSAAGAPTHSWGINFNDDGLTATLISYNFYARCIACSIPPTTGVLAAWNQAGGTYADATNQAGRYNVLNGIVTDTLTEIQWQQNASATAMNWTDAAAYCANQTTGGLNGWRLPNIGEFQTLVDFTMSGPPINIIFFSNVSASNFWASTPDVGNTGNAWFVYFSSYGYPNYATIDTLNKVFCIRSCYSIQSNLRYTVSSGEVTDTITGLIWQQVSTGNTLNQTDATKHCFGLGLRGHTWRLPRVKELLTLIDHAVGYGNLMMDAVFSGEQANYFWSSTPVADPPMTWGVNFYAGFAHSLVIGNPYYVRCVACSVPATTGLLAIWSQAGGMYADSTNQPGRYNVSNGIVTDSLTGLQWQQNVSATAMNWADAAIYCANQMTGGLSGWRVPNIGELGTLMDYRAGSPYLNSTAFLNLTTSDLWSSTPDVGNSGNSWELRLSGYGESRYLSISTANFVRCIRSCYSNSPSFRYSSVSGEVTDTLTGLIWQQVATNITMNQTNALSYCSGLSLNNHTWRLPNCRELTTLIDYSITLGELMMNTVVFSGESASWFWSSTLVVAAPTAAWYVFFSHGNIDVSPINSFNHVRCVR